MMIEWWWCWWGWCWLWYHRNFTHITNFEFMYVNYIWCKRNWNYPSFDRQIYIFKILIYALTVRVANKWRKYYLSMLIDIFLMHVQINSENPRTRACRFRVEFASLTPYYDRNWLCNTIKLQSMKNWLQILNLHMLIYSNSSIWSHKWCCV